MYRYSDPNTGSNPVGGRILKKKPLESVTLTDNFSALVLFGYTLTCNISSLVGPWPSKLQAESEYHTRQVFRSWACLVFSVRYGGIQIPPYQATAWAFGMALTVDGIWNGP